jgi:hypothetical protein
MDWERQKQVIRSHSRGDRRRYSFYTKDVERKRRERLDRWNLRMAMAEWLYGWDGTYWAFDFDFDEDWEDWETDDEHAWTDSGWSVTFLDLMR